MVDVKLYSHAIWTHSGMPIYTDYYLTDKEIRAFNQRGRPWGGNRKWDRDVWRDLQERRRWTIASLPNWLLNINVNTSEGTTRRSGNTRDINTKNGPSHGIYLTNRIRRPCTVEIPYPLFTVDIRDGVFLHKGRARVERLRRGSPFYPAVFIAIHLDLPDEEPFRKFEDLSNHLARVVEEPDDRGFFFWFIKSQKGQGKTPIKDSFAYFIDLKRDDVKHQIQTGDCIKFVVVNQEPFIDPGPTFHDNDEVLARWEDDKWYYKGRIARRYDGHNYYCVKDGTSQCDRIFWEDIILATDHYGTVSPDKRERVRVLAPHPVYYWSYAPGRVIEAIGEDLTVRFYDNNQTNIEKWDVYPARNREKYLKDVEDIQQREKDWEGEEAVIRDESGVYRLGRVNKQIGCKQRYTVTWLGGQCGEQMSIHIYGTYTRTTKFKVGNYILALADPDNNFFLPGEVTRVHEDGDVQRLHVDFVNGKRSKDALSTDSYWMNKRAYTEAKKLFLKNHTDSSDKD